MPHKPLPADLAEAIDAVLIAGRQQGYAIALGLADRELETEVEIIKSRFALKVRILRRLNGKAPDDWMASAIHSSE